LKSVPDFQEREVEIVVNERPLIELIAAVEEPFANEEVHPSIAGSYAGLLTRAFGEPLQDHFSGSTDSHMYCGPHDKTVLLVCDCRETGCWPLMARIRVEDDLVVWSHFEQPHRREKWSHGDLQFTFSRDQYEAELAKLGRRYGWRGKR